MSHIHNLTSRIAKLSRELAIARSNGDEEQVEDIEDELAELEEELEDAEEAARDTAHPGWA